MSAAVAGSVVVVAQRERVEEEGEREGVGERERECWAAAGWKGDRMRNPTVFCCRDVGRHAAAIAPIVWRSTAVRASMADGRRCWERVGRSACEGLVGRAVEGVV